jgi:hypothetical protein
LTGPELFAGPVGEHYRFDSRMMEEVREESIKEAYALFGLAYFHSECLHRELCHAYVLSILPLGTAMTRPRFEEALVRAYALTLGQVIAGLEDSFDRDLFDRLTDAVAKRNFLAHHFWFWRCHLMTSEAGLSEMQKELSELSSLFHNLDLEVTEVNYPRFNAFGISDEEFAASLKKTIAGNPMEPLPEQRLPKKQERLVRAWDVPTSNGLALVFETEDGLLLQLCDVGLGWAYFDPPQCNWVINGRIQPHLPATVISRPESSAPWNYDIELANKMLMCVRISPKDKAFRWTVRRKKVSL